MTVRVGTGNWLQTDPGEVFWDDGYVCHPDGGAGDTAVC